MSFWDKVTDFFGGNKKDKELTGEVDEETRKKNDEILKKIDDMDKAYRELEESKYVPIDTIMPEEPDLKYLDEYDGATIDEIKKQAESVWGETRENKKNSVKNETKKEIDSVENKKSSVDEQKQEKLSALEKQIKELQGETVNKNVKNGIYNSSIMSEEKNAIDNAKTAKQNEVNDQVNIAVDKLNKEIEALGAQEKTAVEKLDLEFATKIQKTIDEKVKERDNEIKKIADFNNDVKEKENFYKAKRQQAIEKQISDRMEDQIMQQKDELENGYRGDKDKDYQERLRIVEEFYDTLPKDVRNKLISEDRDLKRSLGMYYSRLLHKYMG
ncbi:MAG: hypothetical protein RSB10_01275 [Clostridia bacterium]